MKSSSEINEIKMAFQALLASQSPEEQVEREAFIMATRFLGEVTRAMEAAGLNKRDLAARLGVSASHITQLFRGDRLPNLIILAKMQSVLNIRFVIGSEDAVVEPLHHLPAQKSKPPKPEAKKSRKPQLA
jgi:ribosome-binding protein aMBF1 (putative translation factor)